MKSMLLWLNIAGDWFLTTSWPALDGETCRRGPLQDDGLGMVGTAVIGRFLPVRGVHLYPPRRQVLPQNAEHLGVPVKDEHSLAPEKTSPLSAVGNLRGLCCPALW